MTVAAMRSIDSVPVMCDRYLGPSLLAPFADAMARRLAHISTGPLLEFHAGTGTFTQAIAASMSAGLTMIVTDPSADMIAYASKKPGMARITWQIADPRALGFRDATFGIVTCHFGVVMIPDRVQAFQEARRVLKQGGRFVFSVPGHLRQNPVADCLRDTMDNLFPTDPPRFVEHIFHGYADHETIDDDLTIAGFTDAMYTAVELPYAAASARDVAMGYCLGTPLRWEIEARAPGETENVIQAATAVLEDRFGTGPITASMRAQIVSAAG